MSTLDSLAKGRHSAYVEGIALGRYLVGLAQSLGLSEEEAARDLLGGAVLAAQVELERLSDE